MLNILFLDQKYISYTLDLKRYLPRFCLPESHFQSRLGVRFSGSNRAPLICLPFMKFFLLKDICQSYPIFRWRWKQWLILEPT